ncbi:MAG: AAA family ATPase [Nitrospiraceae bacterium]|nr:MAG: AAA family ATPase [Nitrospiraceae bacterium]
MDNIRDLEVLINSHYPIIYIETFEEKRVETLVLEVAFKMGLPLFIWSATTGLARFGSEKPAYNTKSPHDSLSFIHSSSLEAVYLLKDLHNYLQDSLVVRKLRDICQSFHQRRRSLILTAPSFSVPFELKKETIHFEISLPDTEELTSLVKRVLKDIAGKRKISVKLDSLKMNDFVQNLKGLTLTEAERVLTRAIIDDDILDTNDLSSILKIKKQKIDQSGILEYFPREESFSEIGGLDNVKQWLRMRHRAFTDEARDFGLDSPKGILLLGVQGCGKSLIAKAVAMEWGLPLLKLDTGRLYNKYIGETEKNLREAIRLSESLSPVVLWIDEIEKAFAGSLSHTEDGGVSSRILGTFLSWLQEKKNPVFVVATSNDISKLPPELLRKGRLDEIFFVDLPTSAEREMIFSVHLKKRKRNPEDFDISSLVQKSEGFSGAEIEQSIVSSLYTAFSESQKLNTSLIVKELENTYPLSVTMKEKVERLREWAKGRAVQAN